MKTRLEASPLFTDGAVLCRDREIRIFGRADSGTDVTVRLEDSRGNTLAETRTTAGDGRFLACLPPQKAQAGCRLVIHSEEEKITAEDIAVGDVYLAGGQSNMELELRNAKGGTDQVRDDDLLRFFNVPRKAYVCEEQQQAVAETRWHSVNRETAGYNSAVAAIFGEAMRKKHPDVPVGIIGCYWGGTSVTCWMDEETLRSMDEGVRYLEEDKTRRGGKTMAQYLKEEADFIRDMDDWGRKAEEIRKERPGTDDREIEKELGPFPWNPPAGPGSPYRPAGLAESMLAEITPVSLTAALYYQGEEDTARTERYDVLMTAMIRYWRKIFRNAELPFLFVQLPMWIPYDGEDTFTWARTRLAQAAVRDNVRNTGMICLLDQGEYGNIHPVDKVPVGTRLAELAGKKLYGEGEESPRATGMIPDGDTVTVRMDRAVVTRDGKAPALMEVAGEDGVFVPAEAEIDGTVLRLRAASVVRPVQARYAWTDYSDKVNLFGENGLPLEPFWIGKDPSTSPCFAQNDTPSMN